MTDDRRERLRKALDERTAQSEPTEITRHPWLRFGTTVLFFAMITVVLLLLRPLWRDYSGWKTSVDDHSVREAYLTSMEVDVSLIVLTIFVAVVGAWWLRFLARAGE